MKKKYNFLFQFKKEPTFFFFLCVEKKKNFRSEKENNLREFFENVYFNRESPYVVSEEELEDEDGEGERCQYW